MNRRILFQSFLFCSLLIVSAGLANAQWAAWGLGNGIMVASKTEVTPRNSLISPTMTGNMDSPDGKTFSEFIIDDKNKIFFGYNLTVDFGSAKGKYKLVITPLSADAEKDIAAKGYAVKKLPRYPGGVEVSEEETLGLELMVNPKTGERITQYIKIYYQPADFTDLFAEREPVRDFTINDVGLKLKNFEIFADGKSIAESDGAAFGAVLSVYLKGRGRFHFSLIPRPGYDFQKIGIIEGSKILFKSGGVDYKIVSRESFVGDGGHWNLWVLCEPNFIPEDSPNAELITYGSDDASLIKRSN